MLPDLRIVILVAAVAATVLAGFGGYRTGVKVERADWQAREARINAEHAERLARAEERTRATERAAAERYAKADAAHVSRLMEISREKDAALAAVRAGARRLSIPATCPAHGGSALPGTADPAGSRDGGARAELSGPAAEFLVALASEADAVVEQLRACQAIVRARP